VWVEVLGIYDETTEAIARKTPSRTLREGVKMGQYEFAILPEASGKCDGGVSLYVVVANMLRARCGMAMSKPWGFGQ
jgi:hypothetical protein